jgi:hypothetical protein
MSTITGYRSLAYGITQDQHDKVVGETGRNYTEPVRFFHLHSPTQNGGTVPKKPSGLNTIDPKAHRELLK